MSEIVLKTVKIAVEEDSVSLAARKALYQSAGDTGKAIVAMSEMVRKNQALRQALLEPLIEYACGNAVRKQVAENRSKIWNPPPVRPNMTDAQKVALLASGNLLMFPLPFGGKRLGDATRDDVARNAEFYETQAKDMGHKGRWLRLIAQSVPGDRTVAEALSDNRLRELQEEAIGDDRA